MSTELSTGQVTNSLRLSLFSNKVEFPHFSPAGNSSTVFRCEAAGMEIPSTWGKAVPLQKLACSGDAGDILVTSVWNFWGSHGSTQVRTEEPGRDVLSERKSKKSRTRQTPLSFDGFRRLRL